MAPWADLLYACDRTWWHHYEGVPAFEGYKVSLENTGYRDVIMVRTTGTQGYDPRPGCVRTGKNSGYQAINLAAGLGATRIVLLGFDLQKTGGAVHWHGSHVGKLSDPRDDTFKRWHRYFPTLAKGLQQHGVEVVNATPTTALTCFPCQSLSEAL